MASFPHLFQPIQFGTLSLRNRLMMTAHNRPMQPVRYLRYLEERAKGGVALIGIQAGDSIWSYPSSPGRTVPEYAGDTDAILPNPATPEGVTYYDQRVIPAHSKITEVIHRHGAKCVAQLHHLGASRTTDNVQPPVSASAIIDEHLKRVAHPLEEEEIAELVTAWGHAARRARASGFDGVELHAGHFYLINQFLSPYMNHRTDRYGGSLENRMRFLFEIIAEIRKRAGDDCPIGIRINGEERVEGGLALEDMKVIAAKLEGKVSYISVSGGTYTGIKDGVKLSYVSPWFVEEGYAAPYAAAIKKAVKTPVMVVGRIRDPAHAERIIAEGSADLIGMTRALIADPEFATKAREGHSEDIRKCIGANECHLPGRPLLCAVNARTAREAELEFKPAAVKKRVLVIGGGPGGMEAARVAAERGHSVSLYEREQHLGGQIATVAKAPNRAIVNDFLTYIQRQVRKNGVEVHLGAEATASLVQGQKPDAVIIATGARPFVPNLLKSDPSRIVTALDVIEGKAKTGKRVLVVGGLEDHLPPFILAEFLADQGKKVEMISELMTLGEGLDLSLSTTLTHRLLTKGVTVTSMTALRAVQGRTVTVANALTRQERKLKRIDTVVLACGSRADDGLARELKGKVRELYTIGDCRAPRQMLHAVMEGARAANML